MKRIIRSLFTSAIISLLSACFFTSALAADSLTTDYCFSDVFLFQGHSYQLFDNSLNWNEAKETCKAMNGYLATITSQEEQKFIASLIDQGGSKTNYWLGSQRDSNFKFSNWITGEAINYTNWDYGEPNNSRYNGQDENALMIFRGSKLWNDLPYSGASGSYAQSEIGFICEWDYVIGDTQTPPSNSQPNKQETQYQGTFDFYTTKNDQWRTYDYSYSDEWFKQSSSVYQHDLTKMSLKVAMSAFRADHISYLMDKLNFTGGKIDNNIVDVNK